MVLAGGSKGNFLHNVLVNGGRHLDFFNLRLRDGIGNRSLKTVIIQQGDKQTMKLISNCKS